jgi:hypothetical protein
VLVTLGVFAGLLFGGAGRLGLPWLWAYLGLMVAYITVSSALTLRYNPDLVRERMKPPSDRDPHTRRMAALPALSGEWMWSPPLLPELRPHARPSALAERTLQIYEPGPIPVPDVTPAKGRVRVGVEQPLHSQNSWST